MTLAEPAASPTPPPRSSRGLAGAVAASVVNVTKSFGPAKAVDGMSFTVSRGRITAFVGANGAGKTTTLRLLAAMFAPDSGQITVLGQPPADARDRVSYMPEERGLYQQMRVGDVLAYFSRLRGVRRGDVVERVDALMHALDLERVARSEVATLSLGNQQLVQIAVALATDADLYLLDEPFSGLDPRHVEMVTGHLESIVARDAAVVVSSHQLPVVERLCDDLVIVNQGRVTWQGSMGDARQHADRRVLVDVRSDEPWYEMPGVEVLERRADGLVLRLHPRIALREVVDAATRAGDLIRITPFERELAEFYHEVVGE